MVLDFTSTLTTAKNNQELMPWPGLLVASRPLVCWPYLSLLLVPLQSHGDLFNPSSTDALDPVTLLSWAFLCITGHQQHLWLLPTHQMPVMHAHPWPMNPFWFCPSSCGSQNLSAVVSSSSFLTIFPYDPALLLKKLRLHLGCSAYLCCASAKELMSLRLSGLKPSYTV